MQLDLTKLTQGLHDYIGKAFAPVLERLKALEDRPVVNGVNGKDGNDGFNGKDGLSVTLGDVLPAILEEIDNQVKQIPAAKDGETGQRGEQGLPGIDGKSFTIDDAKPVIESVLESHISKWALDFERRAQDLLQKCADRMPIPKDGANGLDGFGFDDMEVEHDGEGNVTLKFIKDERAKEFSLRLPVLIDKGIFKDGDTYTQGNCATLNGSLYIAQKDNPEGRPGSSDDWRLAAKKGRDGKDLR